MAKRIMSVLLAAFMVMSVMTMAMTGASAEKDNPADGRYYTYYFIAPANWFTTNSSIGIYYWSPQENAEWPGEEVTEEKGCIYKFDDGRKLFKVSIWQENEDSENEELTTPIIVFNSWVDASIDPVNGHQTRNLSVEGCPEEGDADLQDYGEDEAMFPRFPSDFTSNGCDGMVYVPDPEKISENEYSGANQIEGGVWYYYWGYGKYGVTPENPDSPPLPDDRAYGDIDNDGKVSMTDVTLLQRRIAKLDTLDYNSFKAADIDGDGKVTMSDVTTMQRFIAKLMKAFPVGESFKPCV